MALSNKTHYALLGIGMDADAATINQAYRDLRQQYLSLGSGQELQARLQLLAEAHACLSNPLRRRIYDNTLADRTAAAAVAAAPAKTLPLKAIGLALLAVLLIGAGLAFKSRQPAATATPDNTVAAATTSGMSAPGGDAETTANRNGQALQEVGKQLMDIDFQISEVKRQASGANSQYNERYRSIDMQYGHLVEAGREMSEHSSSDTPRYSEQQIKQAVEARQQVEQLNAKIEQLEQDRLRIDDKRKQLVAEQQAKR